MQSWKKTHWSMKRGKMIKMVATGTGARKVVIWLVALSWSLRISPAGLAANQHALEAPNVPERRESQHLEGGAPARADVWDCCWVGMLLVQPGEERGSLHLSAASRGSLLSPSPSTCSPPPHTPSGTLQMPASTWEWAGRITWLRVEGFSSSGVRVPSQRHGPL